MPKVKEDVTLYKPAEQVYYFDCLRTYFMECILVQRGLIDRNNTAVFVDTDSRNRWN